MNVLKKMTYYRDIYNLPSIYKVFCLEIFQEGPGKSITEESRFHNEMSSPPLPLFYFLYIQFSLIIYRLIIRYDTTFQENERLFFPYTKLRYSQYHNHFHCVMEFYISYPYLPPSERRHFSELCIVWPGLI